MIKVQHTRNGGWSLSAIFHDAKQHPNLRHAMRAAPRAWWYGKMRKFGDAYDAAWLIEPAQSGPYSFPAGWIVATKTWDYLLANMFTHVRNSGGEVVRVWLSWPGIFKAMLGEEFGVQCDYCGHVVHTWKWEPRWLCETCERRATRAGGVDRMLAISIDKKAKKILRDERLGIIAK